MPFSKEKAQRWLRYFTDSADEELTILKQHKEKTWEGKIG